VVVALSKIPATPSSAGNSVSIHTSLNLGQAHCGKEVIWLSSKSAQFRMGVKVTN
jgi:hypothetical protein